MTSYFITFLAAIFSFAGSISNSSADCFELDAQNQTRTRGPKSLCIESDAVHFYYGSLSGTLTLSGKAYEATRFLAGEDVYLVDSIVYADSETEVTAEVYTTEDGQIEGMPNITLEVKGENQKISYVKVAKTKEEGCFTLPASIAAQTGLPERFCTGKIEFNCPYGSLEGSVHFSKPQSLNGTEFKSYCSLNGEDLYLSESVIFESLQQEGGCNSAELYKIVLEGNVYKETVLEGPVTARIEFWSTNDLCHSPLKLQYANFGRYVEKL